MTAQKAFTLVELLIVVLILGLLAAVVLPQFSTTSATARASMLADDLRVLRSQIAVFKAQHVGVPPGYPDCDATVSPTEEAFIEQMTLSSNAAGETAAVGTPGYRFGPYFSEIMTNPVNGRRSVQIVLDDAEFPAAPDGSHGWVYQPASETFKADSPGADETGKAYFDY